jgi:hypothetical protein
VIEHRYSVIRQLAFGKRSPQCFRRIEQKCNRRRRQQGTYGYVEGGLKQVQELRISGVL